MGGATRFTSSAAIFGQAGARLQALRVSDSAVLRVEVRFSSAKRIEKIAAVLPKTPELLASSSDAFVRAFVDSCPPTTLSRLEKCMPVLSVSPVLAEARGAPIHPTFEIACAKVDADRQHDPSNGTTGTVHSVSIRPCPNAILLRRAHDVGPIFEPGLAKAVPVKRDTLLEVAVPPGAEGAQFEVIAVIFDLLAALCDWIDPRGWMPTQTLPISRTSWCAGSSKLRR